MKHLIIGGPHDGQRIEIPESVGDMVELVNPQTNGPPQPFATTTYERRTMRGPDAEKYIVLAPPDVNVMEKLIAGYRGKAKR